MNGLLISALIATILYTVVKFFQKCLTIQQIMSATCLYLQRSCYHSIVFTEQKKENNNIIITILLFKNLLCL